MELKYALLSYGIPSGMLPIHSNGKLQHELFQQQTEERRKLEATIEEQMTVNNLVACPTHFDVLLGRGKPFQEHEGNSRLNLLVDVYCQSYTKMTKSEKTKTTAKVIGLVYQSGGRFLRRLSTSTVGSATGTNSTETSMENIFDVNDATTATNMGLNTSADSAMFASCTNPQSASTSAIPVASSFSFAAGWEIVHDKNLIHRKVNNVFKTRKNHSSSSSSSK